MPLACAVRSAGVGSCRRRDDSRSGRSCHTRARGQFHLVLAGGDTPRGAYRRLCGTSTDWSMWNVYFGDERCLPVDDPARNSRMAGEAWLDHVFIPTVQFHAIPAELGAVRAAQLYRETLHAVGEFDLVLLGLGED